MILNMLDNIFIKRKSIHSKLVIHNLDVGDNISYYVLKTKYNLSKKLILLSILNKKFQILCF